MLERTIDRGRDRTPQRCKNTLSFRREFGGHRMAGPETYQGNTRNLFFFKEKILILIERTSLQTEKLVYRWPIGGKIFLIECR